MMDCPECGYDGIGPNCYCRNTENPGVTFCKECNRKLTQGSPTCIRCGKCSRLAREKRGAPGD